MRRFCARSVASYALACALAAPVYAQSGEQPQSAQNTDVTGDIIVTAQFRETRLQDTPIAITAVNAALLEQRGQTSIADIANQSPNVTLRPQPQNGGAGLIAFIRGVGQTDFNYALDPGVGVYIDDVYIPTLSSSLLDLMDLDRVEILRGPQGTLAGKNSIGGAIKLFSAKPDGSGGGTLEATYGSYNRLDLRGMADFAVTDNLFVRLSGAAKSRDGYLKLLDYGATHPGSNVPASNNRGADPVVGTQGGQSYVAGRIALRWLPSDALEVNLSGDYTSDKSEPAPTVLVAAGLPGPTSTNPNPFNPAIPNPGTNANGGAWLPGKNGSPVPVGCAFVPYGVYGCDSLASSSYGGDRRFISYANFVDGMLPTSQSPYKPYTALQNQDFKGWGIHGNVTWTLSDSLNVVWISSYREYQSNFGQDQDATPVPVAQLDNQLDHHAWSQELRLNGKVGTFADFTLGGFYFDQKGTYSARVDLNYAGIDFLHGPDTTPSTSKALFANGVIRPLEGWSISGGLRYTRDEKTYTYFRRNPDGTVPFGNWTPAQLPSLPICEFFQGAPTAGPTGIGNTPNCLLSGLYNVSDSFKGDRWDWRISTDFRFSPELLVYGSVATGFKGGGVNPRPFFGPSAGSCTAPGYVAPAPCNQLGSFNPETLTTYELGFKSDLFDRRVRLNGAVFLNKYNDMILTLSACPSVPCLKPTNVGKADVKGFELETTIHPFAGFTVDGSLSYINFQYKEVGTSGISLDAVTPYTPEWTYSFGLQYDHEITPGTVSVRFDGSYQSDVFTETSNSEWSRVEGNFLANGRLSFTTTDKDWRISLEVQNMFNKYYFLTKSDVSASLGVVTGVPAPLRTWAVSVRRSF
ncbi:MULTISPECIES: TonB-dependent receptor [unclassified Sphingobium]|uniref:TonB-dependent receptor n=1 Tax=unclassified Sphingobium TaxID=2611147 RepID=UPI002225B423|nr:MULTISPECIES: TonB-dependent receptor [unclassified Sphingobium]MCW2412215.1 iron complex outermembrane receptor protein [Sphingobium sp. B8D3D]MCW2415488.1 iron complex outermembrane receptor protein [Sphingobium sp. B8D3A]